MYIYMQLLDLPYVYIPIDLHQLEQTGQQTGPYLHAQQIRTARQNSFVWTSENERNAILQGYNGTSLVSPLFEV